MKKYTGMIIGGLFGAAVIAVLFFAIIFSVEKQGSDASKMATIDEPAGTNQAETPECQTDNDCGTNRGCFRGKCTDHCGGTLAPCPAGMICSEPSGWYCVKDLDGERRQLPCMQGIELCNGLDDDCDGEADEGCGGPAEFKHCWTLPETSARITFVGEVGYRYRHIPGDPPVGSGLIVTSPPWQNLAEVTNTSSACFRLVLDPGWSIEYQLAALPSGLLGCAGHYPPGTLNGSHDTTLGNVPVDPILINGVHDCEFRFHLPMP